MTCPTLTNPIHGSVNVPSNIVGITVTYTCTDGFVLTGEATRTCGSDGMWSDSAPTCEREFCVVF